MTLGLRPEEDQVGGGEQEGGPGHWGSCRPWMEVRAVLLFPGKASGTVGLSSALAVCSGHSGS